MIQIFENYGDFKNMHEVLILGACAPNIYEHHVYFMSMAVILIKMTFKFDERSQTN